MAGFRRFTVDQYHRLIEDGHLTEDDDLELIEGYLVHKMARNAPHDIAIELADEQVRTRLPLGWRIRIQSAVTLPDSEPEPDIAIVRGAARSRSQRHPSSSDVGQLIEVSASTLDGDRADKCRIYARANIAIYWIINLVDRQIEVYSQPTGPTPAPAYANRQDYRSGDSVPLVLDGVTVGAIAVDDVMP